MSYALDQEFCRIMERIALSPFSTTTSTLHRPQRCSNKLSYSFSKECHKLKYLSFPSRERRPILCHTWHPVDSTPLAPSSSRNQGCATTIFRRRLAKLYRLFWSLHSLAYLCPKIQNLSPLWFITGLVYLSHVRNDSLGYRLTIYNGPLLLLVWKPELSRRLLQTEIDDAASLVGNQEWYFTCSFWYSRKPKTIESHQIYLI